jgi:hypothetical protein
MKYIMAALLIVLGSCCIGVALLNDHAWYHRIWILILGMNVFTLGIFFPRAVSDDQ